MTGDGSIGDYGGPADYGGGPADTGGGDVGGGYDVAGLGLDTASYSDLGGMLGYGFGESIPGLGASEKGPMHSPGLSYATLNVLNDIGLGRMGIPGFNQNVEQALAAQNVHNILNYAVPALVSLTPGYGMVSGIGRGIAGLHGLATRNLTAEQVLPGIAAGVIGAKTGIPSGVLEGVFSGDLGRAAGAGAQAGLGALIGGLTGSPLAGALASSTLGPAVGRSVSDALGGSRSGGLGAFTTEATTPTSYGPIGDTGGSGSGYYAPPDTTAPVQTPKLEDTSPLINQLVYGVEKGVYGPLFRYDIGEDNA
jgi:hypothetical protein